MNYKAFTLECRDKVALVTINRPDKINAMNADFWAEIIDIFRWIDEEDSVRAVVLSGAGKHFSSGIDVALLAQASSTLGKDIGRNAQALRQKIKAMQASFTAVEQCRKPVLAAIHGYCIGGAVDLVCACDMRYATEDARFSIKEVDMGMAADVGTLQRMPRFMSDGLVRELAYTGCEFNGIEALQFGLVNSVYKDHDSLMETVFSIARKIAEKSPVAVRGTKAMIQYMRDHRVDDGLDYMATWNAAMLQSEDLRVAVMAHMSKQKPDFKD